VAIRTISLCTGAGGLDLGLHVAVRDVEPLVYVEREAEAVEILVGRFEEGSLPAADVWSDLSTFDARRYRGRVDLILGGLPCQPFSVAGKRQGDADERYIWPEFFRVVAECRPAMVWLENVPPFVSGGHFRPIGEELCRMGYEIEDPLFLAAEDVGAPHKRERVFILAVVHAEHAKRRTACVSGGRRGEGSDCGGRETASGTREPDTALDNSPSARLSGREPGQGAAPRHKARLRESSGRCDGLFPPGPGLGGSGTLDNIRKLYAKSPEAAWRSYQAELANTLRWRDLLDAAPWLAPSISAEEAESSICHGPDGLAAVLARRRTDALRAAGNGCVALQGAVAFVELVRRITG